MNLAGKESGLHSVPAVVRQVPPESGNHVSGGLERADFVMVKQKNELPYMVLAESGSNNL